MEAQQGVLQHPPARGAGGPPDQQRRPRRRPRRRRPPRGAERQAGVLPAPPPAWCRHAATAATFPSSFDSTTTGATRRDSRTGSAKAPFRRHSFTARSINPRRTGRAAPCVAAPRSSRRTVREQASKKIEDREGKNRRKKKRNQKRGKIHNGYKSANCMVAWSPSAWDARGECVSMCHPNDGPRQPFPSNPARRHGHAK